MHTNSLELIFNSVLNFLKITKKNYLLEYLGKSIIEICGNCFAIMFIQNNNEDKATVYNLYGFENIKFGSIVKIIGYNPLGKEFTLARAIRKACQSNLTQIHEHKRGLPEITKDFLSKNTINLIQRISDIGKVYTISMKCLEQTFFIEVFMRGKEVIQDIPALESFIKIATIALERILINEALKEKSEFLDMIYNNIDTFILTLDVLPNGKILYNSINPSYEKVSGLTQKWIKGKSPSDLVEILSPIDIERLEEKYYKCRDSKKIISYEETLTFRGVKTWLLTRLIPVINQETGKITQIVRTSTNITERKKAENRLELFFTATEQNSVSVLITDKDGRIEYINPAFSKISGYTPEEVLGKNPRILKSDYHPPEFYRKMWKTILSGKVWKGDLLNKNKSGELYWESSSITPLRDESGIISHFVAVKEDITQRKKSELYLEEYQKRLQVLATTDEMTGSYNRRTGVLFLEKQMELSRRDSSKLSIAFIDLNNLKKTNDKYGHSEGDFLILSLINAIKSGIRSSDLVCRMGGDEFMIIFPHCNSSKANRIIKRIQENMNSIRKTSKKIYTMTFSYGITEFIPELDASIDMLIERADKAMYLCKEKTKESKD